MSDILVQVKPEINPVHVYGDSGTYELTVSNLNQPKDITVLSPDPVTPAIIDESPTINIFPGSGSLMQSSDIIKALKSKLDLTEFVPGLEDDLTLLQSFWTRIGRDLEDVLVEADVNRIVQTSMTYTDTEINTMAVNIQTNTNGIVSNTSLINQTANNITLRVDNVELTAQNNLSVQTARIDVTENGIANNVTRMDANDLVIQQAQSDITQQADRLTLEITARESLANGAVAQNSSNITQMATEIANTVTRTDALTGRVDSAETRLTATESLTVVNTQNFNNASNSIQAIQSLTAGHFSVKIEKSGSYPYVAGFEMVVGVPWVIDTTYRVGQFIRIPSSSSGSDYAFRCIQDHISSNDNKPALGGSGVGNAWWEVQTNRVDSAFNISAEQFNVLTPGGAIPVFQVDTNDGSVSVNGSLIIQTIESDNYAAQSPTESWFKLDPTTGFAKFNNMQMTFSDAGYIDTVTFPVTIEGNVIRDGNNFSKPEAASSAWDAQVYSTKSFKSGCRLQSDNYNKGLNAYRLSSHMHGISEDPTGLSFNTIDFAWHSNAHPSYESYDIYVNGAFVKEAVGSIPFGQKCETEIIYDNKYVKFYLNGTLHHTVEVGPGKEYFMDLALYGNNTSSRILEFGSYAGSTQTIIDGGLITTGVIKDAAENLIIDFNTSTITANTGTGLVVNAANGITVNSTGGIKMNSGADIDFHCSSGNKSAANFYNYNGTLIGSITPTYSTISDSMGIKPGGSSRELYLGDNSNYWERIFLYCYSTDIYAGIGPNARASLVVEKSVAPNTQYKNTLKAASGSYTSYLLTQADSESFANNKIDIQTSGHINIICDSNSSKLSTYVGNYQEQLVVVQDQYSNYRGITVKKNRARISDLNTTAYDYLIGSSVGDCIEMVYSDGRTIRRFRRYDGAIDVKIVD